MGGPSIHAGIESSRQHPGSGRSGHLRDCPAISLLCCTVGSHETEAARSMSVRGSLPNEVALHYEDFSRIPMRVD